MTTTAPLALVVSGTQKQINTMTNQNQNQAADAAAVADQATPTPQTVRIRLRYSVPVDPRLGLKAGRVFEATRASKPSPRRGEVNWWVVGDTGERVGVLVGEADEVSNDTPITPPPPPAAG